MKATTVFVAGIGVAWCGAGPQSNSISGTYYAGVNRGQGGIDRRIQLKGDGTFVYTSQGCFHDERYRGAHLRKFGWVVLLFDRDSRRRLNRAGTPKRLYPVRWADRSYLVGDDRMLWFCSRYLTGWRGESDGTFYVRSGTAGRPPLKSLAGMPEVPASVRRYLKEPLDCHVLKIARSDRILVDKGSADGVALGTQLGDQSGNVLTVRAVRLHDCTCELPYLEGRPLRRGTKLRPVWRRL